MLTKIVSDNVSGLLQKHGIRASYLVECHADINKTFMSRMLSGEHDFLISKLESLCEALQRLEPGITVSELLDANMLENRSNENTMSADDVRILMRELIIDLIDLDWIEIKKDVPISVVGDYIYSAHIKRILPESPRQELSMKKAAV